MSVLDYSSFMIINQLNSTSRCIYSPMSNRSLALFIVGGLTGAGIVAVWLKYWARRKKEDSDDIFGQRIIPSTTVTPEGFLQDEIIHEQLTRNVQFFGAESQLRVSKSFVVVVGLGGVGSHLAHLLLRSGVGRLRLVDFDLVSLSSLNRHALATREDVGTLKTTCLQQHFKEIMPEVKVETLSLMYSDDSEEEVLCGQPDFVVDAIDNVDTKVSLLRACHERNIRVLCIGGAGAKADPTRLRFADISESITDPLCRAVRHRLRKQHNIKQGIPTLLSTEKPRCSLVPLEDENHSPLAFQIIPNFRVRTIPVLGTSPALFGMAGASFVLCELASKPFQGEPIFTIQSEKYDAQYDRLLMQEELTVGDDSEVFVDLHEVKYLIRDVWRGLSAKTMGDPLRAKDKGMTRMVDHLILTRWDNSRPATLDNLVLLTFEEAEEHRELSLLDVKAKDPAFFHHVDGVLQVVRCQM